MTTSVSKTSHGISYYPIGYALFILGLNLATLPFAYGVYMLFGSPVHRPSPSSD